MPKTLAQLLADVRQQVDEPATHPYSDTDLTRLINQACKDIARRTETIQTYSTSLAAVAGTGKYDLPVDVIRVHRVEFVPTGGGTYTVSPTSHAELDRMWGVNQSSQSAYPSYFTVWGTPGITAPTSTKLQIQFFPVPSQSGVFNVYYYRLPYEFVTPPDATEKAKTAEYPAGWDDLITMFASYHLKRRRRDDTWAEEKKEYEERLIDMIDVTRNYHDSAQFFTTSSGLNIPSWLYEG